MGLEGGGAGKAHAERFALFLIQQINSTEGFHTVGNKADRNHEDIFAALASKGSQHLRGGRREPLPRSAAALERELIGHAGQFFHGSDGPLDLIQTGIALTNERHRQEVRALNQVHRRPLQSATPSWALGAKHPPYSD